MFTACSRPVGSVNGEPQSPTGKEVRIRSGYLPLFPTFPFFLCSLHHHHVVPWLTLPFHQRSSSLPPFLNLLEYNSHAINVTILKYTIPVVYIDYMN